MKIPAPTFSVASEKYDHLLLDHSCLPAGLFTFSLAARGARRGQEGGDVSEYMKTENNIMMCFPLLRYANQSVAGALS